VRVERIIVRSGVWTRRRQPLHRGRRNHRPSGTSPARTSLQKAIEREQDDAERDAPDSDILIDHCIVADEGNHDQVKH